MQAINNTSSETSRSPRPPRSLNRRQTASIDLHGQLKRAQRTAGGPTFRAVHALLDDVAVWVKEGGAGGEVIRRKRYARWPVENDAMIGELLVETLEDLGRTVCALERDVANAFAAAAHWRPDLMIVDVGLGEASGVAAVKEILRSGFVPHVFVTGDRIRGLPLGRETVLIQKPFRVLDLERAIQRRSRRC